MVRQSCFALLGFALLTAAAVADDWRQFRGPGGRSVADSVSLPVEWSVETGANIAWDADLPGDGVSGPIVVDGRVFVTAASGPDHDRLHVLCFDSSTGKPLWSRQLWATGRTLCYRTSSVAAPTPVSDGEFLYAFYSSNDLVCFDLEGNLQWIRGLTLDHPGLGNDIGMASSPVVVGDAVIVQCESQTVAFVGAYDRESGATLWETPRKKESNWTSPLALPANSDIDAPAGVLLQNEQGLALHNANTGEQLWEAEISGASIPSPSIVQETADGRLVLAPVDKLSLLKQTGSSLDVVWRGKGSKPGSPSPIVYGDRVFVIARGGILSAIELETGEQAFKKRLKGTFWATPLAAEGRLYCINESGTAFVVDAAGKGEILAKCDFGESIYGSPAVADDGMFVRSNAKLWKIAVIEQARATTGARQQ